ncbi:hypothetical protein NED98_17165 [Sphingomonas sp. MMSM20]|nr:hypothetical protein [Sphingomonas lycopersici]
MAEQDRRTPLVSLASVGLVLAGCAKHDADDGGKGGGDEGEVTASEDLMREHGVLRRILIAYREVVPVNRRPKGALTHI